MNTQDDQQQQQQQQQQQMGDVFRQNRSRRNNNNNNNNNYNNDGRRNNRNNPNSSNSSNNSNNNSGNNNNLNNSNNNRDQDRDRGGYHNDRRRDADSYGHSHQHSNARPNPRGSNRRSSFHRNNNKNNNPNLKLEYGKIHSLLDKFGFIYCANRPIDIFFHYSESNQPIHSLEIGMEVMFYVAPAQDMGRGGSGGNNNDRSGNNDRGNSGGNYDRGEKKEKLSAYSITVVEQGTVIWEKEDEPGVRRQGLVERVIRSSGGGGGDHRGGRDRRDRGNPEGTIRVHLVEEVEDDNGDDNTDGNDNDGNNKVKDNNDGDTIGNEDGNGNGNESTTKKEPKKGPIVRFTTKDIPKSTPLSRNDLVEFTIVTEKRSGLKYARTITILQTERERLEEEREKVLMENAVYEKGVVSSLKKGYGFLKSNRRSEEVYFHYSHIYLPDPMESDGDGGGGEGGDHGDHGDHEDGNGDNSGNHDNGNDHGDEEKEEGKEEHTLKEGQDMEFYVVTEKDANGRSKISAREISFLEKGSVVFRQTIAKGVTGKITACPTLDNGSLLSSSSASSSLLSSSSSSHGRKKYNRHTSRHGNDVGIGNGEKDGKIQLDYGITFQPVEDYDSSSSSLEIKEVVLHPHDCPVLEREASRIEASKIVPWVREGDTLLFDVVRDVVDGVCRAVPTSYLQPNNPNPETIEENTEDVITEEDKKEVVTCENEETPKEDFTIENKSEEEEKVVVENKSKNKEEKEEVDGVAIAKIRLISLGLEGRVEGTIASIKENFGFIRPSSLSSDIYFRLDEVFPIEMAEGLWRNRTTIEYGSSSVKSLSLSKGARVIFDLVSPTPKNGSRSRGKDSVRAERIVIVGNKKPVTKKSVDSNCQGYILMEPSHTSLANTPSHIAYGNSTLGAKEGGRWGNCVKEKNFKSDFINAKEEGSILLLSDPANVFGSHSKISYASSVTRSSPDKGPKRGDLVCFMKGKGDKARDIRILKRNAAERVKGKIADLNVSEGTATFNTEDGNKAIPISLSEVISCDVKVLKENVAMEGILHNEEIIGICRSSDLYLTSSIGSGLKERPRLNLTVKKELKGLGGKIIAQSGMAKGPDGTTGFHSGWTTRDSKFVPLEEEKEAIAEELNESKCSGTIAEKKELDSSNVNDEEEAKKLLIESPELAEESSDYIIQNQEV